MLNRNVDDPMVKTQMNENDGTDQLLSYKPSVFYFRAGLRGASSKEEAVEVGLVAVRELEQLKAWVRSLGLQPPKVYVLAEEADEKQWECEG